MDSLFIAAGLTTFGLGAVMMLFAWSVVHQNRRREAARVELLSGLAFPDGTPAAATAIQLEMIPPRGGADEFLSERADPTVLESERLFREPEKSDVAPRRMLALAAACAVTAVVVSTYAWFAGSSATAAATPVRSAAVSTPAPAPAPVASRDPRVELLALDHAATPAGLVVTGRLRNPADGASLHDVIAVVDVLDREGRILTTARAPIGRPVLNAGESSDFTVAAAKAANVARYRVEFHAKERERVPQIDLRNSNGSRSE